MSISRRRALSLSGATLAGLSMGVVTPESLGARQEEQDWPEGLVERPRRAGFPAPLPLNPDGSAPEHPEGAAGPITDPVLWRTEGRTTPEIDFDYRNLRVKVDTRGLATLTGTLHFEDLRALPPVSGTFLLQCGATNPHGIVKWTGVRFGDFADMLGLIPEAQYCRVVGSDGRYADEPMTTMRRSQVMLAWMMNDAPIPPQHGAPLRLVVPFRYGQRSIKAIQEITFATPGLPMPPLPA